MSRRSMQIAFTGTDLRLEEEVKVKKKKKKSRAGENEFLTQFRFEARNIYGGCLPARICCRS